MPKRARQAHIPKQVTRKRKGPRRDPVVTGSDAYLDVSRPIQVADGMSRDPVGPIPVASTPRSPAGLRPPAAFRPGTLRAAGQLPTFERAYLVDELKRIGITAGGLLGLIIALAFVLR